MDIKMNEFSIPMPKLGTTIIKYADDFPSFKEETIRQLITYARKHEFDYVYGHEQYGGKHILYQMLQEGTLSLKNYLSIIPALDDLQANIEIVLE